MIEFNQGIEKSYPKTLGTVRMKFRLSREDAEDAVQNAAVKALLYKANFRGDCAFSTWFTKIAINEALMMMRKRKCVQLSAIEDRVSKRRDEGLLDPHEANVARQTSERIAAAMTVLGRKEFDAVERFYFRGERLSEMPDGKCRSNTRLNRGRAKIGRALREMEGAAA